MIRHEVVTRLAAAYAKAGASEGGMHSMVGEFGVIEFEDRPTEEERSAAFAQWRAVREAGAKRHLHVVQDDDDA